jgi:adenosylmethionine-8-amino-7-oxononanoate aminotransferase
MRICRDAGALLIVDEVVTGFGRTGRLFGSEHWDIRPDIMTLAKGLTSGYVPMGATVVSREVNDAFEREPLLHLNTYAGHPLGCAAALANIEILIAEELPQRAAALAPALRRALDGLAERISRVARVSAIGYLSSVELDVSDIASPDAAVMGLRHGMYERGVIARCAHSGGVLTVVFYPCLVADEDDVARGVAGVGDALNAVLG